MMWDRTASGAIPVFLSLRHNTADDSRCTLMHADGTDCIAGGWLHADFHAWLGVIEQPAERLGGCVEMIDALGAMQPGPMPSRFATD